MCASYRHNYQSDDISSVYCRNGWFDWSHAFASLGAGVSEDAYNHSEIFCSNRDRTHLATGLVKRLNGPSHHYFMTITVASAPSSAQRAWVGLVISMRSYCGGGYSEWVQWVSAARLLATGVWASSDAPPLAPVLNNTSNTAFKHSFKRQNNLRLIAVYVYVCIAKYCEKERDSRWFHTQWVELQCRCSHEHAQLLRLLMMPYKSMWITQPWTFTWIETRRIKAQVWTILPRIGAFELPRSFTMPVKMLYMLLVHETWLQLQWMVSTGLSWWVHHMFNSL